jgi:hypothetical protein
MYLKDGDNRICIYGLYQDDVRYDAMDVKPDAFDTMTIYGAIGQYNGTIQIKNAELINLVVHQCTFDNEATCNTSASCSVCGEINGDPLGHNYVDGACERCGATQPSEGDKKETSVSKSHTDVAGIAGVTAGQNTGVIAGKQIALNEDITIVCAKGKSTSDPCVYSESIRLYQGGATITVKAAEGCEMTTIVIHLASKSGGQGPITVSGGTASALSNYTYTITVEEGVSEVVITTAGTDKNNRLYVDNISVEYKK